MDPALSHCLPKEPALKFVAHVSAQAFLDTALPWLMEDEAAHTLVLGLALARAKGDPPGEPPALFATLQEGDRVLGCVFRTPPHAVGLTHLPDGALPLTVRALRDEYATLPGVVGPRRTARAFAAQWTEGSRLTTVTRADMLIMSLDALSDAPRRLPDGRLRGATVEDGELVVSWLRSFEEETRIPSPEPKVLAGNMIAEGVLFLWETDAGPVSMAAVPGTTPNTTRLGYVFTPAGERGKGYAAALVREVSRILLQAGTGECVLYVDQNDPVARRLYERIGYRTVTTAVHLLFVPAGA